MCKAGLFGVMVATRLYNKEPLAKYVELGSLDE